MSRKLLVGVALIVMGSGVAYAVTGSYVDHAGVSTNNVGYIAAFSLGSCTGCTLSDGKTVVTDADIYGGPSPAFVLNVSGFTSNPGQAYFSTLSHNCTSGSIKLSSSSATYSYDATHGIAAWSWTLSSHCMLNITGHSYSASIS